jgi:tetratricopeptide (TPR) repeat protein
MGKQTTWAIKWIEEGYDSPYAIKTFRKGLATRGFDHAADVMNNLKQADPAFNLSEGDVNEFGFILLQQKKSTEAVEIFKLNVASNPASANAYDSLAEAYEKVGNKELAIQNFKRCVELNPKNDYAAGRLKVLESNAGN